jgi:hypothetical protein
VHYLQGKTERVTPLIDLLQEFERDKRSSLLRHQAAARSVGHYDANNAYQYILAREETQLSWLARALADLGGRPADAASRPITSTTPSVDETDVFRRDAQEAQAFVDRWRPRVEAITNARHRIMLRVILGETLEQKRLFDQALAGRTDMLGRRTAEVGPVQGEVLPARWIE